LLFEDAVHTIQFAGTGPVIGTLAPFKSAEALQYAAKETQSITLAPAKVTSETVNV
jgi:hypothetical protein